MGLGAQPTDPRHGTLLPPASKREGRRAEWINNGRRREWSNQSKAQSREEPPAKKFEWHAATIKRSIPLGRRTGERTEGDLIRLK